MRHLGGWLLSGALVSAGVIAACGSDNTPSQFGDGPDATTDGQGTNPDGSNQGDGQSIVGNDIVSIKIQPADPIVVVQNGVVPAPTQFQAIGITSTGQQVPVGGGTWTYDRYDVGAIDSVKGGFNATGFVGGVGTVSYRQKGLGASTTATVTLQMVAPGTVDPGIIGKFGTATDQDPAMTLVYPYDKTVFPRGLPGPVVQWNGGGANDVYHVKITSPTASYEAYGTAPPPSRYALPVITGDAGPPIDVWRKLTDSTTGALTVAVQRYDGTKAYLAKTQTWNVAAANLAGAVYYWQLNTNANPQTSSVTRLRLGDPAPQDFLQLPAGVGCVACHSVSKDGSTVVAAFNGGSSPWGTFDTASGASLYSSGQNSGFEAISPDGKLVAWRQWADGGFNPPGTPGFLSLSKFNDATELARLNVPAGFPSHPRWSPDGKQLTFSVRSDGNGLDFNTSTLWNADVSVSPPGFANIRKIVDNTATRSVVTFPAFSPDSNWIAFERSTQARSRGGHSEIWLGKNDGSVLIPLDQTNGQGVIQQTDANYEPTFMPVAVGGYMWLVIVSERTYGNTLTDTNAGTRTKQLWVTAIDASPQPGKDPSHPSFWLPGQFLDHQNMRGEWALNPCKKEGEGCNAGYECCDGFCRAGDGGAPVCVKQPPPCAANGDKCNTASDCCSANAQCIGGFCNSLPR